MEQSAAWWGFIAGYIIYAYLVLSADRKLILETKSATPSNVTGSGSNHKAASSNFCIALKSQRPRHIYP